MSTGAPRPANRLIGVSANGAACVRGYRCADCGAVASELTRACRRCASRREPEPFAASQAGRLHSWSVVKRSYPGVTVPFTSAIVDLDDGLTLKGTLKEADGAALTAGMAVNLVFDDAGGAVDAEGAPYVGFHFVPAGGAS
jgi:uncharacterized protein